MDDELYYAIMDFREDNHLIPMDIKGTFSNLVAEVQSRIASFSSPMKLTYEVPYTEELNPTISLLEQHASSSHNPSNSQNALREVERSSIQIPISWYHAIRSVGQEFNDVEHLRQSLAWCGKELAQQELYGYAKHSYEQLRWVLSMDVDQFDGTHLFDRYGWLTSNLAESFNAWIKKARFLPIAQLVDHIWVKMMKMSYDRHEVSNKRTTPLVPSVEEYLLLINEGACYLHVNLSTSILYEVYDSPSVKVNLENRMCTCRQWQALGLPCKHAATVIRHKDQLLCPYISDYFSTEVYRKCYSFPRYPIPDD
ncbi:uncharacterized protein LOC109846084 [Asparagus officinalis]|uniref:uncharacterized protein LOC109846084 n=1 Tax=Asparagus officinalis TaxID=4686 RepID=UPI00098E3A7A|nr:uncharacterized protein LOC109846084 [Asparagus officinalis]